MQRIQSADSLEYGFRVKFNQNVDNTIDATKTALDAVSGILYFYNDQGAELGHVDFSPVFARKNEIVAGGGDPVAFQSASEESEGTVRFATLEEALTGTEEYKVISPATLAAVLDALNIGGSGSETLRTLAAKGDNNFEQGIKTGGLGRIAGFTTTTDITGIAVVTSENWIEKTTTQHLADILAPLLPASPTTPGSGNATTPAAKPIAGTLLCVGSSLAAGYGAESINGQLNSYVRQAALRAGLTFYSEAIPGSYTDLWLDQAGTGKSLLERHIITYRPEYVYLGFGLGNEINSDDYGVAADRLLKNLKHLIAIVRRYDAVPIVGGPYNRNGLTTAYPKFLRQITQTLDSLNCISTNLGPLLDNGSGQWLPAWTIDGLHLTTAGNADLSYCIPKDYFQTRTPQHFPLRLDRTTRGRPGHQCRPAPNGALPDGSDQKFDHRV